MSLSKAALIEHLNPSLAKPGCGLSHQTPESTKRSKSLLNFNPLKSTSILHFAFKVDACQQRYKTESWLDSLKDLKTTKQEEYSLLQARRDIARFLPIVNIAFSVQFRSKF